MTMTRLLFLTILLGLSSPAFALRCGGKLVSEGDPKSKVLKICGEPAATQQRTIVRSGVPRSLDHASQRSGSREELLLNTRSYVEVLVEEWTYNFGPRKLMRVVRFENGLVSDVTQLGYGYRE
jgi:hypothetical protein